MKLFDKPRFFKVTFAAGLVLLLETVLFHVLAYIHDFFGATSVISYAVLGLGLGAFAASQIRMKENTLFFIACVGTAISLYGTSTILVRYPVLWAVAAGCAMTIFFPTLYITVLFRNHPGGRVYLYDMCGAFLGVLATVLLYSFMRSETIILLATMVLPVAGLLALVAELEGRKRILSIAAVAPLIIVGVAMFSLQASQDAFNIFKIFNREVPVKFPKVMYNVPPERLAKSYDSLVGRVDIVHFEQGNGYVTCYDGHPNDQFHPEKHREYAYFKKKKIRWPTGDVRVVNGVVDAPRIFIIGSAARGITNLVKKITPVDNIIPVDIQPAILEVMTKDFYDESGRAYEGLKPEVGNAISILKDNDKPFDIITFINTHSGPNIGTRSGPDYLHTKEHYSLFLDNLTRDGYLQFEERPHNRGGALGLYRMINTLWHTIKEKGSADPSAHFLIYEWQGGKAYPTIIEGYRKDGRRVTAGAWYVGMAVFKTPITGDKRKRVIEWYHDGAGVARMAYLKDYLEAGEFSELLTMAEAQDFSPLAAENFDSSLITNDRPFASFGTHDAVEIETLLTHVGIICLALSVLFLIGMFYKAPPLRATHLSIYNILIGFGYFLIEIMLMQSYQNLFISPSWSLLLVLGLLLLSSGVGGMYGGKLPVRLTTALLIPVSAAAVYAPSLVTATALPVLLCKVLGVTLIGATGFLLGTYFPMGLVLADRWGLSAKVPYLFALNSTAGSFAVILALYSGVKIGYQSTILAAVLLYCAAGLLVNRTQSIVQQADAGTPDIESAPKKTAAPVATTA